MLWNRESAIAIATEKEFGRHIIAFAIVYAILATLLFVFGTAGLAVYAVAWHELLDPNFSDLNRITYLFHVSEDLEFYLFNSLLVLTGVVVVVSTVVHRRATRTAGITDKVLILCP